MEKEEVLEKIHTAFPRALVGSGLYLRRRLGLDQ